MDGKITYKLSQITKSMIDDSCLLTHEEALRIIVKWFANERVEKNIAIASNYPWVYKNKSEITRPIDEYKFLIVPPLSIFGRMTLSKFRINILNDKYARLCELQKLLKNEEVFKKMRVAIMKNDESNAAIIFTTLHAQITHLCDLYTHNNTTEDLIAIVNVDFTHIPNIKKYVNVDGWINAAINKHVHYLRDFRNIPMKGNIKFISLLQGRKSIIRNTISKKVKAFRSQIVLRPELKPNEIVLPYTWADTLNVKPNILMDVSTPNISPPQCFHYLGDSARLLVKRDPAINGASISAHDTVAFARTDNIFVGMAELEQKNADFDGDTESAFIITDKLAINEIDFNMLPQNNLRIFQQIRISFSEPHILYMHQRKINDSAFKHARLYKYIQRRETYRWLSRVQNREMIEKLNSRHPNVEFYKYIEPTKTILRLVLNAITQIYSSRDGYEFYNSINENILRLANGETDSVALYDPNLPSDYYMQDNLLCPSIIRVCLSGAKGSPESLYALAEKIYVNDKTTSLTTGHIQPLDKKSMFKQLTAVNQSMADKSREVQVNGHNFFKSNIGYDTISFDNGTLCYNGKRISNNLAILSNILLLPPEIANIITFA